MTNRRTDRLMLEICVDSVASARAAEAGGADRLELGADLAASGGLTPSAGQIAAVTAAVGIPVHVLIRPRGGDFCYSDDEFAVMRADIAVAKERGAAGVVIGILTPNGGIDRERTAELIRLARPLSVTFHRGFDMSADPLAALSEIIALGCDRLLTSGQEPTAFAGRALIAQLVARAAGRIAIMPGGGVSEENIAELRAMTGAREFHSSARVSVPGPMRYRNPRVNMGSSAFPEYERRLASTERVLALRRALTDQGQ